MVKMGVCDPEGERGEGANSGINGIFNNSQDYPKTLSFELSNKSQI